jgi:hypothetical protein
MTQPPRFTYPQFSLHLCKLQKALYGLKQAPRAWFLRLSTCLIAFGFHSLKFDTSLFIYKFTAMTMYVLIYVDDIIITCSIATTITDLISQIHSEFAINDLGNLNFFLGIECNDLDFKTLI